MAARHQLKGTGVYLIPNPAKGPLATTKIKVPDLTIEEAALRGTQCIRATWVPEQVRKIEAIPDECDEADCSSDDDCDPGCFCDTFPGGTNSCL